MRVDERLHPHITNRLAPVTQPLVTGIVGDAPSRYAKTPPLWNAVYRELGWDAISLAWDVVPTALAGFVQAARESPEIAGFSVTNPYKIAIMPLLDEIDELARQIGAVNTVARDAQGRFVGYNTDGQGALDALTRRLPGLDRPFLESLAGRRVLMVGAGGAARAVAFYLASRLGRNGAMRIVNREASRADDLASAVRNAYGIGDGGSEGRLADWIGEADVVVNASVKGQTGWRKLADGSASLLEPYSALAPASPACVAAGRALDSDASRDWFLASKADIARNVAAGLDATAAMAPHAACFDLIYAPLETTFLRHARVAGHPTQNGKWMNIAQAADGFARKVCTAALDKQGVPADDGYVRAFEIMTRVW